MNSEMEKIIDQEVQLRKVCEDNQVFQQSLEKSIAPAKELISEVFQRLSLKEKPFKLYPPAEDKEIEDFKEVIAEKFGTFPSSAESGPVAKFYETHCVKGTDLFQVKKCTDKQCSFHEPLNSVEIEGFPDPIPYEVNGIPHYKGTDPEEKNIPSLLLDVSKRPHNILFPPTAQSGKNVRMLVKCVECKKPRRMHSKTKLKLSDCNILKRSLKWTTVRL